jgi:hypothetical protein
MMAILRSTACVVAGCLMLGVLAVAGYVVSQRVWIHYMVAAYRQIEVGDRVDRVVYALGVPDSVKAVPEGGWRSRPEIVIRYRILRGGWPMNWTFRIDLSGRVAWKYFSDGC